MGAGGPHRTAMRCQAELGDGGGVPHRTAMRLQPKSHEHSYAPPMRTADLGIRIGRMEPGPLDAITDVAGVRVGHTTLISR